jgi:hypothetical protein
MQKKIKDAVKCPQKGCPAYLAQEEYAYFCDTCKVQMPDDGLELRVWHTDHDPASDDERISRYNLCSWRCLFLKMAKARKVDFVSLPLASAVRGERRFQELRRFVQPMLVDRNSDDD